MARAGLKTCHIAGSCTASTSSCAKELNEKIIGSPIVEERGEEEGARDAEEEEEEGGVVTWEARSDGGRSMSWC